MSIKNIVVSAELESAIDLTYLEQSVVDRPAPERKVSRNRAFGSPNIRNEPATLLQIFKNGRVISVGGKTEGQAKRLFTRHMLLLSSFGIKTKYKNYRINNIVASFSYGKPIRLDRLASKHGLEFEPELFPAARFRDDSLKITANIFHTGNCVILGAKTTEDISIVTEKIIQLIQHAEN